MLSLPHQRPSLTARIQAWTQEVSIKNQISRNPADHSLDLLFPQGSNPIPKYLTRLQVRTSKANPPFPRPAFAETSGNQQTRKRKAKEQVTPQQKKRARRIDSYGPDELSTGQGVILDDLVKVDLAKKANPRGRRLGSNNGSKFRGREGNTSIHPSEAASGIKKPGSPGRSRGKDIEQGWSSKDIDLAHLGSCKPAIRLKSYKDVCKSGTIPKAVTHLRGRLQNVPIGFIPLELQASYITDSQTPENTKIPPPDARYLPFEGTPYPSGHLQRLKHMIQKVVDDAAWNQEVGAHEGMWGDVLAQIIHELEYLPYAQSGNSFKLLNVEKMTINPIQIRPTLPEGPPIVLGSETGSAASSNQVPQDIGRMVDWTLAFRLTEGETTKVEDAFSNVNPAAASLNQTLGPARLCPFFASFELKKMLQSHDPRVQLAIWAAAEFLKKNRHRWSIELPVFGVTVNGHIWEYYLFYAPLRTTGRIVMMGPERFGSTSDINGVWEILYRLDILIKWGMKEYREWVDKNIIGWATKLARSSRDEEE